MFTGTRTVRRKSQVWTYFTEIDEGKKARCSYCSRIISIAGGSIGNLKRHLGLTHQIYLDSRSEPYQQLVNAAEVVFINTQDSPKEKCDSQESINNAQVKRTVETEKPNEIDELLLRMIVKEYHPFSLVEDQEFKAFVNLLCPEYNLPTKKTLSTSLLPNVYMKIAEIVNLKLEGAQDVCLTTDSWTSTNNRNFMSVTAYFINPNCELDSILLSCVEFIDRDNAENIAEGLKETVNQWGLENKVVAVVSSSVNNMTAGIQQCNWQHLPCFAHCLNSVVQTALSDSEISITINKIRGIVEYFNSNSTALAKLYSIQKDMGQSELKIKQDVAVRWNSTYNMMKAFLEVREAIISALTFLQSCLPLLTSVEWMIIETTVQVLRVFHEVTKEISSEKTVSRSKVILLVRLMTQSLFSFQNRSEIPTEVSAFVATLINELCKSFEGVEEDKLSVESTLLDPRFKRYGFSDEKKYRAAVASLKDEVSNVCLQVDPPSPVTEPESSVLWSDFDSQTQKVTVACNSVLSTMVEIENYLQEPLLNRCEDPVMWWKERQFIYPHLFDVMKKRLCLMAVSVPCKRLFSKAGHILLERRNNITSSKLSQILFLNHNL